MGKWVEYGFLDMGKRRERRKPEAKEGWQEKWGKEDEDRKAGDRKMKGPDDRMSR